MKRELQNQLKENNDVEELGLDERVNNVNKSLEAIVIYRRYEEIINAQTRKQEGIFVKKENF